MPTETLGLWLPRSPMELALTAGAAILVLYLARSSAHGALRGLTSAIHAGLMQLSGLLLAAQKHVVKRNREVLLEMGRQSTERLAEREFHRVNDVVQRDFSHYPALHRKLSDQITRIDEDYRQATEAPPTPPEWAKAVEAIAAIPSQGDPSIGKILRDIEKRLSEAQRATLEEYRKATRERHRLLNRLQPFWRRLDQTLSRVGKTIHGLEERSNVIDRQMETYEQIRAKSDDAVRTLSASSMTHFVASGLVLAIALLGGFINFHLIALPMSEMVGSASYVGPVRMSDIAALVIIFMEIAMGLFLMEALGITHLFPIIGSMDDKLRKRMFWVSFGILFTLAGVESSLAYMRDMLAADKEALTQSLAGVEVAEPALRWIPSLGQMVMGFMLPFALAFAAIPLESFIHSSRVVVGGAVAILLRAVVAALEVIAVLFKNTGPVLTHLYDFVIIAPLRIEALVKSRDHAASGEDPDAERLRVRGQDDEGYADSGTSSERYQKVG